MSRERQSYIALYIIQVGFQVSFQVEPDAGHVESDLESPGFSFGPKFFVGEIIFDKFLFM